MLTFLKKTARGKKNRMTKIQSKKMSQLLFTKLKLAVSFIKEANSF